MIEFFRVSSGMNYVGKGARAHAKIAIGFACAAK